MLSCQIPCYCFSIGPWCTFFKQRTCHWKNVASQIIHVNTPESGGNMWAATHDSVHCRAQVSREVHIQKLFLKRGRCAHGATPISHIKFLFVLGKANFQANLEGGEGGEKEDEGKSSKCSCRACCPDPPAKGWKAGILRSALPLRLGGTIAVTARCKSRGFIGSGTFLCSTRPHKVTREGHGGPGCRFI